MHIFEYLHIVLDGRIVLSMVVAAKRIIHFLRLSVIAGVLLAVPFLVSTQHAAAQSMHGTMHDVRVHPQTGDMQIDCATYCATRTSDVPRYVVLDHEEMRTPDPTPQLHIPHYLMFWQYDTPRNLRPSRAYGPHPIRPPNIIQVTANYRL